jgi:hypothetical protein
MDRFATQNTQDEENFSFLEYSGGDTQASQYDYNDFSLESQQTNALLDGSQSHFVEPDLSGVGVDELDAFQDLSIVERELEHACRYIINLSILDQNSLL